MCEHDPALQGRPWSERDFPLGMTSLSLMGLPRNMMGLEGYSLALYDERDLVEEIADHMLLWNLEMAKKVFSAGITPDFCCLREDICCKTGPLFSPRLMREIMVPRWRTFTDFLRSNGVLPFEAAAGNDVREVRRRYGKVRPLLAEGGYFPMLDHYAPPDISFENYLYDKMKLKNMRRTP